MKRIIDIAIASTLGAALGAIFAHRDSDTIHARQILVTGKLGSVSINGDTGISLYGDDYTSARLLFHEPGTGSPGKGGPVLWMSGLDHQAIKISPTGQEIVRFKDDEKEAEKDGRNPQHK